MAGKQDILVLGSVPLPIGGVTIHVSRLLAHLEKQQVPHRFVSLHKASKWTLFTSIMRHRIIHLNTSNARLMWLCAWLCSVFGKKLIITYHGNFGRKTGKEKELESKAISLCYKPLFLNPDSLQSGMQFNERAAQISAFIPPAEVKPLAEEVQAPLTSFKERYKTLFCTNAFNVSIDPQGNETYGISGLIEVFSDLSQHALVFSDPTGNYTQYLSEKGVVLPQNVLIIDQPHDFVSVIQQSVALIRATTTDGDSLSIKEALYYHVPVIASDCVPRHEACDVFPTHDWRALKQLLLDFDTQKVDVALDNGAEEIANIYTKL